MNGPPPNDSELLALRAEVERSPGSEAERAVFAKLEASLGVALGGVPASRAHRSSGGRDLAERNVTRAVSLPWSRSGLVLSGVFVLGGAAGAGVHWAVEREPAPRIVFVDRAVPVVSPAAASSASSALPVAPPLPLASKPPAPRPASRRRLPPSPSVVALNPTPDAPRSSERPGLATLAEEQRLLDQARASLSRHDWDDALRVTDWHAERFATSVLGEEREAIAIKALGGASRVPEARARMLRFEAAFPRSPLLPSLRRLLATLP